MVIAFGVGYQENAGCQRKLSSLGSQGTPSPEALLPEGEAGSVHGVACGHMHLGVLAWAGPKEPEMWAAATPGSLM